jgi:hypothetical protein
MSCKSTVDCMIEGFKFMFNGIIEFIIGHTNIQEDANAFGGKV